MSEASALLPFARLWYALRASRVIGRRNATICGGWCSRQRFVRAAAKGLVRLARHRGAATASIGAAGARAGLGYHAAMEFHLQLCVRGVVFGVWGIFRPLRHAWIPTCQHLPKVVWKAMRHSVFFSIVPSSAMDSAVAQLSCEFWVSWPSYLPAATRSRFAWLER